MIRERGTLLTLSPDKGFAGTADARATNERPADTRPADTRPVNERQTNERPTNEHPANANPADARPVYAIRRSSSTRALILMSMLTGMALGLAAVESMIPPFIPFPGVKLGLPNIVTLVAFSLLKRRQVFAIVISRLFLAALVLGTFLTPVFWISCGGGLLSYITMALCSGRASVSVAGMSLAGAAAHNVGQLLVVSRLLGSQGVFYYLPWLLLWSAPVGLFTGIIAGSVIVALSKTRIDHDAHPVIEYDQ